MAIPEPISSIHQIEPQLANLRSYWLGWGSSNTAHDDMPLYRSGLAHPLLNGVLRIRGRSVDEAVETGLRALDGVPHLWWIGADSDPGVLEQLQAGGGQLRSTLPVMAIDLKNVSEAELPGLAITRVVDDATVSEYVEAYSDVFGIAPELRAAVVAKEKGYATAQSMVERFIGTLDGQVVGTAQLSMSHGVAGIYWVSTREPFRGRGIATALTTAALLAGRERGFRIGSLQASSLGAPVYRQLGFETVGEVQHVSFSGTD